MLADSAHVDYVETTRKLRLLKNIPEELFTSTTKNLRINLLRVPNISDLQDVQIECAEDIILLLLGLNGSAIVPNGLIQTAAMGKYSTTFNLYTKV